MTIHVVVFPFSENILQYAFRPYLFNKDNDYVVEL